MKKLLKYLTKGYMKETVLAPLFKCIEAVLEPAWRIGTDTVDYYVNCVTGTVFSL